MLQRVISEFPIHAVLPNLLAAFPEGKARQAMVEGAR
jgi:hypothetical protein